MKRLVLIVSLLWMIGCAASDRSAPALTAGPIETTAVLLPAPRRSVELTSTNSVTTPATIPLISTQPIERTPAPTAALPHCPPPPRPIETPTQAAVQHFEHGLMLWLQDRAEIWTLIDSPLNDQFYWRVLPDAWSESQAESDPSLQPPADRLQPVRGFGVAWRLGGGSYGPQRDDLGWAIDQELGFATTLIYYPQGYYTPDCTWLPKSGIYELRDARGTVYQFVGAGGIARIITSSE
jgi:hypothetical protein